MSIYWRRLFVFREIIIYKFIEYAEIYNRIYALLVLQIYIGSTGRFKFDIY